MIKVHVDYNERELLREGIETIVVDLGGKNAEISTESLEEGARVVLSDGITECEAVLRHGRDYDWVADVIEGTTRDLPRDDI